MNQPKHQPKRILGAAPKIARRPVEVVEEEIEVAPEEPRAPHPIGEFALARVGAGAGEPFGYEAKALAEIQAELAKVGELELKSAIQALVELAFLFANRSAKKAASAILDLVELAAARIPRKAGLDQALKKAADFAKFGGDSRPRFVQSKGKEEGTRLSRIMACPGRA